MEAPSKQRRPHGPALSIILSVGLVLALGVTAVLMAWLWPQRTGVIGQEYVASEVFAFDSLQLEMEYLTADIAAGLIVPVLTRGEVTAAVIFGLGWAHLHLPPDLAAELTAQLNVSEFREDFDVLYLPATYQSLERLKTLAQARHAEDPDHARFAQNILDLQAQDAGLLRLFARPSPGAAPGRPTAVRIYTVAFGRVDYLEGARITIEFAKPLPKLLSFPHPGRAAPAFPQLYVSPLIYATVGLYLVLAGLLWALCFALTLHVKDPEWVARSALQGGGLPLRPTILPGLTFASLAWPLVILLAYMGHNLVGAALLGNQYPGYAGDMALASAAAVLLWRRRVPRQHLGVTSHALGMAIGAGALVGFYVVVAGSVSYPGGVRQMDWERWLLDAALALLIVAPARETLLRSVAQTSLERYTGRAGAVILTAAVAGLTYLGVGLIGYGLGGRTLEPLLMEGLLVVPTANALAGYLYMRTRNLAAPVLVTGLVELLPRVLTF